jgi:hypothetical protein
MALKLHDSDMTGRASAAASSSRHMHENRLNTTILKHPEATGY